MVVGECLSNSEQWKRRSGGEWKSEKVTEGKKGGCGHGRHPIRQVRVLFAWDSKHFVRGVTLFSV
jgi:hypothetical protein